MVLKAKKDDVEAIVKLAQRFWPDKDYNDLQQEMLHCVDAEEAVIFVYEMKEKIVAFVQCKLRHDHVEGTVTSPVGYLEGMYVREKYRRCGVATEMIEACEQWAKEKGCSEIASDCDRGNTDGFLLHIKMKYEEVNRIICFKKNI